MARFFYFSGAIFALGVFVLAALPYMVPRSLLRAELEGALSHLTGYEVRVVGSLQVRFLPRPYLFARQVRLSIDRSVSPAGVLLALDEVEAGMAVLPLFRGKVDFSFLRLVRPVLAVDSGDDFFGRTANRFIRFSSVLVEDGTVKYLDLAHGRQIVLQDVNGKLSADSLSGPLKTQARFIYQGERYETEFSIGRWAKRRVRMEIELRSRDRPDVLRLKGSIATKELGRVALSGVSRGRAALDGVRLPNFRGEISVNAAALGRFVRLPENIKLLGERSRITANVDIQGEQIKLGDFLFETEKMQLEGQGLIDLSAKGRVMSLSMSSPHIDFAHILHDAPDASWRGMVNSINDLSRYLTQNNIALDLSADVKVFMREGYQIKDVILALEILPDRIAVDLDAVLPGASALKLTMSRPRKGSLFTGRLGLAADDFSALSSWFVDDEVWSGLLAALPTQLTRSFELKADLELNHMRAKLNKIKAHLGDLDILNIEGSLSDERSGAAADLSFALDRLALNDEPPFAAALAEAVRWGIDIKTRLAIRQITWRDMEIKNFKLSGRAKGKRFVFDEIRASGLPLGRVAVRGVLDWQRKNIGRWRLAGDVGGSAFIAVGRLDSKNAPTEIKAKLSHRDAARLAKQLGIPASLAGAGKGRAVLRLNGWPKDRFKIAAGARFGNMRYALKGKGKNWFHQLTGRVKAKGYAPMRLIEAAGLDDIARASNKDPFMLKGNLSYVLEKSIKVDQLKLIAGKGDIQGDVSLMRKDHIWLIQSDLRAKRLPFSLFEPKQSQKAAWSSRSLPFGLFKEIKGQMKVKVGAMFFGGLAFQDSRLDIDFLGAEVRVKNFDVGFASGRISGTMKLSQRDPVPKFDLHFSARDVDLSLLTQKMLDTRLISGALNISGALAARGATPASLIGSLDGAGKITTSAGSLHGLDMALLNRAVPQLGALSHLGVVLVYTFSRGKTDFNKISGKFVVKNGVVISSGLSISAAGVNGEVDLSVNLGRRLARSVFLFTLPARLTYPPVEYIVSGSWLAPQKKFNAAGFEKSFASEMIHRGIGKIKAEGESEATLPIELIDLIEYAQPQS